MSNYIHNRKEALRLLENAPRSEGPHVLSWVVEAIKFLLLRYANHD